MAAVAVLFLSGSYLTYSDSTVTIPMTGIDVLTSLFYGGEVGFVNYGKILYVSIPWYAIGAGLLIVLAAVVFAVWTAISGFAGKKDAAAVGIAQMAFGGLLLLFYILCLVGKFMAATSASGEKLPFYKLYEIRPLFLLTACLFVFAGGVAYGCKLGQIPAVKRFFPFYVILIVPTLLILVFNVYPSILQTILAFKEYYLGSGVWGSEWAGLSNFKFIFSDARMQMVIWQTVYLSFLRLLAGIIPAVLFALVFYHITSKKYRSVVQTIVYIPHFFSWVVIYAIISAFLTPNGVVNNIQRSASLFLVKNLFSMLMTLFTFVAVSKYPLYPTQLSFLGTFTIGTPAFLLAMQPDKSRIEGHFLTNVVLLALPAALTDFILLAVLNVAGNCAGIGHE